MTVASIVIDWYVFFLMLLHVSINGEHLFSPYFCYISLFCMPCIKSRWIPPLHHYELATHAQGLVAQQAGEKTLHILLSYKMLMRSARSHGSHLIVVCCMMYGARVADSRTDGASHMMML